MNCPDSYQNSKLDISNCKTKALYTILSYLGLKRRFWEKKWSYIMQGSKLPTTLAKHQELFFDPLYHQFSLNMTILRGSYYNSQLSPLWIDQGHPLYRKKKLFPSLLLFLCNSFGKTCQIVMTFDTVNIVIFKCYTKMPHQEDNVFIKYFDC